MSAWDEPLTEGMAVYLFFVFFVMLGILVAVFHIQQTSRLDALEAACAVEQVEVER